MPVLNGMPYLLETLESIQAQHYQDAEILVWDNGSTDGTLQVLSEWIPRRIPGRVITNRHLSLGLSLRALVEEARPPYCARIDADDLLLPSRLELQMEMFAKQPDLGLVATDLFRVGADGAPIFGGRQMPLSYTDILHHLLRGSRIAHPTVTFHRESVLAAGNYRDLSTESCPYWPEDYDLWLRLLPIKRCECLPDRLLFYRQHDSSLSANEIKLQRVAKARSEVFVENAAPFAGIENREEARRLVLGSLSVALPTLHKVATHFAKFDGVSAWSRWRMSSFQFNAYALAAPSDWFTKMFIRGLGVFPHSRS